MTANATTLPNASTRTSRRQIRHVELQGIDASRIISSLSGRNTRTWPTSRTVSHA